MKVLNYIGCLVAILVVLFSCDSKRYERALKSANKDTIINAIDYYYDKEDWEKVNTLYQHVGNLLNDPADEKKLRNKIAYANYYDENYYLAGSLFKRYYSFYPKDSLAEESLYMSAICYYKGSPEYNLDQKNTYKAIEELQQYINTFPNSENVKKSNEMIVELRRKLEKKAFENAKQYYKLGRYKAATIAFENALSDYPDSYLKDDMYLELLRSELALADLSLDYLREERYNEMMADSDRYLKEINNEDLKNEVKKLKEKALDKKKQFLEKLQKRNNI